ncbi:3-hydroxy-acyl-CoA-dehydrogenase [Lentinula aff. detonsa]|uniref:3-hydroxy-acyl-CoA-dehydrogenase n=1 Tax=Lentinula aff. detonsa TaxID=2804958 RepID=A0AA38L634_9AGAR|nr:3-hydroxy-acyl-CoA-dehydrogenase [Lentinula aff. detonsa]
MVPTHICSCSRCCKHHGLFLYHHYDVLLFCYISKYSHRVASYFSDITASFDTMKISNRTFVVSGGSSGLGLATVRDLLQGNAYVAVLDLSSVPSDLIADEGSSNNIQKRRLLYIKMDVTQEDQVESAVDRVVEWSKSTGAHLGGVINGAGIAAAELTINRRGQPHSTRTWDRVLAVNLTGTFHLTRLVAKHLVTVPREYQLLQTEGAAGESKGAEGMEESDGERGVIVMIASTVAYEGQAGQIAYAASKGAIRSMTLPMARDMSRYGVRVVSIAPGPFKTPMTGQFSQSMTSRLEKEAVLFPKRYGTPEEFAATVRWILECAYVNGETLKLTGGTRVPTML